MDDFPSVGWSRAAVVSTVLALVLASDANARQPDWFHHQTEWHGFSQRHFEVADRPAYVVVPEHSASGKPWVWRARFPGYHAEMDIELLRRGFHIAYVDVAGMFGCPDAIEVGNRFYDYVTNRIGLAAQPALEGVSRGGLFVYNWAASNPDKVACIYCDTPVCDFKSWPGGQGTGRGAPAEWKQCLQAWNLTEESAATFDRNPVDTTHVIAAAKIPILHIVSEDDQIVPPGENTYLLANRMEAHGHSLSVISVPKGTVESNGHHFDHPHPDRVVQFIEGQTRRANREFLLRRSPRIVFLGDSITYSGVYAANFETWMLSLSLDKMPTVINVGLPSETVSGLSEEGHAGGRFPRPVLSERLQRVLDVTQPDLVFACYGINCGIYQPFHEDRFLKFQQGIIQMKEAVEKAGATLILMTPPTFDDKNSGRDFSYDEVMHRYSQWLVEQRNEGWLVIDLHDAMARELARQRNSNPDFTFQPDAVHPDESGHRFMAMQMIDWFGGDTESLSPLESLSFPGIPDIVEPLIKQRLKLRRDAWLHEAGHLRPGIQSSLSIEQAEQIAERLTDSIQRRLSDR